MFKTYGMLAGSRQALFTVDSDSPSRVPTECPWWNGCCVCHHSPSFPGPSEQEQCLYCHRLISFFL